MENTTQNQNQNPAANPSGNRPAHSGQGPRGRFGGRPGGPGQRPNRPGGGRGGNSGGGRGGRPGGNRPPEVSDGFAERVLDMRRVTRVVKGGKRFRFRATLVIGDGKGRVGVGIGKGADVQQTVAKAKVDAKKNLLNLHLKDGRTLSHEVTAKYSAARVLIRPAEEGHGIKAGGSVRVVLAMAGVKDATAKILSRTPNKLTNALATIEALRNIKPPKPAKSKS